MIAGVHRNLCMAFCVCQSERASILREIHVFWAREGFQRPVDKAVEEDEAGTTGPNQQDGDEGGTKIVDHLRAGRRHPNNNPS